MRTIFTLLCVIGLSACDDGPTGPSPIRSFDTVNYRVIGTNIIGSVFIDYSTPTNGIVSTTSTLATPFNSGPIVGFNQFTPNNPTITVTILQSGCIEAQILINALVERVTKGCGPGTTSVSR